MKVVINDDEVKKYIENIYSPLLGTKTFDALLEAIATPPSVTSLRLVPRKRNARSEAVTLLQNAVSRQGLLFSIEENYRNLSDAIAITTYCDEGKSDIPQFKVVVGVRCAESVMRGADVFVPGVITADRGIVVDSKVVIIADIHGKLLKGCQLSDLDSIPDDLRPMIALGTAVMSRLEMRDGLHGIAVRVDETLTESPNLRKMPSLNGFPQNKLFLQNLPSMVAAIALNVEKGATVLDMCAAPGGKTTHIASLVGPSGKVVALERSSKRAEELAALCCTFEFDDEDDVGCDGEKNQVIEVYCGDSKDLKKVFSLLPGKEWMGMDGTFKYVLLDAPCSGIGLRPRLLEDITWKDFSTRGTYQLRLLQEAVRVCASGGVVVFSTCTLSPMEGEMIVFEALKNKNWNLKLEEIEVEIGEEGLEGFGLQDEERRLIKRFIPAHGSNDWSAFFVAKFRKG